jgi:lipopolysaccharide transport system ATP-binding protein
MLNGLIKPDKGRIEMNGRIGALIELGSGFNPILTGRENIYNNGSVLGLTKRDIDAVLDEIIEFSEIGKFIDTPVQYYSSGMKVRLGFSVAVHMKPDVLILDEVLAVGDSGFRMKSFNKINEIMRNAAVIFVSHSMPQIANITNKVLLMEGGVAGYYGVDVSEGIDQYFNEFSGYNPRVEFNDFAELVEMMILPSPIYKELSENNIPVIDYGDDINFQLRLKADPKFKEFHVRIQITDKDLKIVGVYDSFHLDEVVVNTNDWMDIEVNVPNSIFINGEYAVTLFVQRRDKINNKWDIMACYRYWKKFKMKSSMGLGLVPSVVYLPGKLNQKIKV